LNDNTNHLSELELARQEIQQLQSDLEVANQNYKNVFENAGDSIFIIDLETSRIINHNDHATRRFGYLHSELLGMMLDDIEIIDENESIDAVSWESTDSGTQVYECHYRHKDGRLIPVEVSSALIRMRGQVAHLLFVRNISIRKQIEAERLQLINDLDSFAHTVAHDIKNPLSLQFTWSVWLRDTWEELTVEEIKDYLNQMVEGSQRSINIVDELLLFASVRKQDGIKTTSLDMDEILDSAIARLAYMINEYQAEIIFPDEWHVAIGYSPWIIEVWVNYISNAIKYGGAPPQITVGSTLEPDQSIRFWIQDRGQGIEADKIPQLFNMFDRLGETQIKGHGLGLSIVKRIIEKLNGQVSVESIVGQGSIFSFTLPAPRPTYPTV
jgi:PAS domain S-box-containing protein